MKNASYASYLVKNLNFYQLYSNIIDWCLYRFMWVFIQENLIIDSVYFFKWNINTVNNVLIFLSGNNKVPSFKEKHWFPSKNMDVDSYSICLFSPLQLAIRALSSSQTQSLQTLMRPAVGLLDYGKNPHHDYLGQYWNHVFKRLFLSLKLKIMHLFSISLQKNTQISPWKYSNRK